MPQIVHMDALGHALSKVRLKSPLIALLYVGADTSISMGDGDPPSDACPFHYVVSGALRLVTPDFCLRLQQGDLVFLPHWQNYHLETGSGRERLAIRSLVANTVASQWSPESGLDRALVLHGGPAPVAASLLGGICLFDQLPAASLLRALPAYLLTDTVAGGMEGLLNAVLAFVQNESEQRPGYAATAARLLEATLIETLRSWTLGNSHRPGLLQGMIDPDLSKMLHAVHINPGRDWSLPEMARMTGQSRSKFAAHFKAAVGLTPAAYVRHVRFQMAEERLMSSNSIARIAIELGYGSSFAFSRAFEAVCGRTPAEARRNMRSSQLFDQRTHPVM